MAAWWSIELQAALLIGVHLRRGRDHATDAVDHRQRRQGRAALLMRGGHAAGSRRAAGLLLCHSTQPSGNLADMRSTHMRAPRLCNIGHMKTSETHIHTTLLQRSRLTVNLYDRIQQRAGSHPLQADSRRHCRQLCVSADLWVDMEHTKHLQALAWQEGLAIQACTSFKHAEVSKCDRSELASHFPLYYAIVMCLLS